MDRSVESPEQSSVGDAVGADVGLRDGPLLGLGDGEGLLGGAVASADGDELGGADGSTVGIAIGHELGGADGSTVGLEDLQSRNPLMGS